MISAVILSQIARSGEDLSNVIFDNMQPLTPKEARMLLKSLPSVKADRQWRAFKIKARRKIVNMFRF